MKFILYLLPVIFVVSVFFLYLDKSSITFRINSLYRKKWHKYLYAVPASEIRYQIRNNLDSSITKKLKRFLVYRRIGYGGLLLVLTLLLLNVLWT